MDTQTISDVNVTTFYVDVVHLIPNAIFICLYFCLGVASNATIIHVYRTGLRDSKDERYFIPYLAFSDMISCVTMTTYALFEIFSFNHGRVVCDVLSAAAIFPGSISGTLVLTIAIQRYQNICKPRISLTIGHKRAFCFAILVGTVLTAVSIVISRTVHSDDVTYGCSVNDVMRTQGSTHIYNMCVSLLCLFCVIIVFALYIRIGVKIRGQFKLARGVSNKQCEILRCQELLDMFPDTSVSAASVDFLSYTPITEAKCPATPVEKKKQNSNEPYFYSLNRASRRKLTQRPHINLIEKRDQMTSSGTPSSTDASSSTTRTSSLQSRLSLSLGNLDKISASARPRNIVKTTQKARLLRTGSVKFLKRKKKRYHRFVGLVFIMTTTYMCLLLPKIVLTLIDFSIPHFWGNLSNSTFAVFLFLSRLYILVFFANALIYGFSDRKFRQSLKRNVAH